MHISANMEDGVRVTVHGVRVHKWTLYFLVKIHQNRSKNSEKIVKNTFFTWIEMI